MIDRRIGVPAGKLEFVHKLIRTGDYNGPFRHMVDVLVFAAAVGVRHGLWNSVKRTDGDPIRMSVFESRSYDTVINLLALEREDGDVRVLADTDEMANRRAEIFEGYADGGLEYLKTKLRGAPDYLEPIVLMLDELADQKDEPAGDYDLRDIIGPG